MMSVCYCWSTWPRPSRGTIANYWKLFTSLMMTITASDGDEFRELLLWTTGDASNSETVHAEIEDLADADAEAHIQSGAIDEADQFP